MPNTQLNQGAIDDRFKQGDDRMARIEDNVEALNKALAAHSKQTAEAMDRLSAELHENTRVTEAIKEVVDMGRGMFKLGKWLGKFLAWFAPVATGLIAAWVFIRGQR